MLVLDTNVLSELMQPDPNPVVVSWLDQQPWDSIWITATSIFETRYGIHTMPAGKKKQRLTDSFEHFMTGMADRTLAVDQDAAEYTAALAAKRYRSGINIDMNDAFIAGIALARRARLVTRNTKHFDDLDLHLINPWKAGQN